MKQEKPIVHRCPRCRSRHHTDCIDPDTASRNNGWLMVASSVISLVVVALIVFGIRALFIP